MTTGVYVVYEYKIDQDILNSEQWKYVSQELVSDGVKKMATNFSEMFFDGDFPAFLPMGFAVSRFPGSEIEKKSVKITKSTNFPKP